MYYEKTLAIVDDYLGPAAGRFLDRQIRLHLHKNPGELEKHDIAMLAIHIRSGLAALTKDEQTLNDAFKRIAELSDN